MLGFGLRQALVHPLTVVVHLLAMVVIGLAAGALTETLITGQAQLGASSLASMIGAQQLGPQIALGTIGVVGGLLLARVTRRLDLTRRAEQWGALRAMGWASRQVVRAQRAEGLAIGIPALLITAGIAVAAALMLHTTALSVTVAVVTVLVSALLTFGIRTRGDAR